MNIIMTIFAIIGIITCAVAVLGIVAVVVFEIGEQRKKESEGK